MDQNILKRLSELTAEEHAILNGQPQIDRGLYMDGSRDVITGDKLLKPGRQIAIRPHTRFAHFPEHTHDYVEMVYMCTGETTHMVNGERLILRAGELLILGRNARQEILPAGENDVAVNFVVRPDFFAGTLPFLGEEETPLRRFLVACLCGQEASNVLHFQVSDVLPVQNLIENLLYTLIEAVPNKHGIHEMTMGLLFAELMNHTETLSVASAEQSAVVSVLRYVETHYALGSLTEIAEQLHYAPAALSRLIRQKTGKTYTELLQEKRLSQSAWLLRNTTRKVDEIAHAVGYENISYFHRIFAARYHQSPKQYRDCK